MRFRVHPYKQGSASAKALSVALGGKVLKLEGSKYRERVGDVIINWGSGGNSRGFNSPAAVAAAANKLVAFQTMAAADVRVPEFWTSAEAIPDPFPAAGVVCRTILNGHSGAGIVLADTREALVPAPLYTRYVPKRDEYRVHVVRDEIVAVQRKARREAVEEVNWRIRNHANGFVFAREGVEAPADVLAQATAAVTALGLDFGAVDVVFNERSGLAYVLEVNTAPGLEGSTVNDYAAAFTRIARV